MAGSSGGTLSTCVRNKQPPVRHGSVFQRVENENSRSQGWDRMSGEVFLPVSSVENSHSKHQSAPVISWYRPGHHVIIPSFVEHRTQTRSVDRFGTVAPVNEANNSISSDTKLGHRWREVHLGSYKVTGQIALRPRLFPTPHYKEYNQVAARKFTCNQSRLFVRYDVWSKRRKSVTIPQTVFDDQILNNTRLARYGDLTQECVIQPYYQTLARPVGESKRDRNASCRSRVLDQHLSTEERQYSHVVLAKETCQSWSSDCSYGTLDTTSQVNRSQLHSVPDFLETDLDEYLEYLNISTIGQRADYADLKYAHSFSNCADSTVSCSGIMHSDGKTKLSTADNSDENTPRGVSCQVLASDTFEGDNNDLPSAVSERMVFSRPLDKAVSGEEINADHRSGEGISLVESKTHRLSRGFHLSPDRPSHKINSEALHAEYALC